MPRRKKAGGLIAEFKAFALKGNVIDLAVGVIIGGAFGKITASLVGDVVMPLIGLMIGGVDFSSLNITLAGAVLGEGGEVVRPALLLNIGSFIKTVTDFFIIALTVFLFIKLMNRARHKKEPDPPPAEPKPTKTEELLEEIRDLMGK